MEVKKQIKKIKEDKAPLQQQLDMFTEREERDRSADGIYSKLKKELEIIRLHFYSIREEYLKPFMQDFIHEIIASGDDLEVKYNPSLLLPSEIVKYSGFMDIAGAACEGFENSEKDEKTKTAPHAASGERFMDIAGAEGSAWTISISAFIKYPRS